MRTRRRFSHRATQCAPFCNRSADNAALSTAIFDGAQLRAHLRVLVNGRDIELAQGLDTPLEFNDQVAIFPPVAGGAEIQMSHLPWRERSCGALRHSHARVARSVVCDEAILKLLGDCFGQKPPSQ